MALLDPIPDFLLRKQQMISTVVFTALFSLVFLLVSIPFSHNVWFKLGPDQAFGFTVVFFLIVLMIVVLSKEVMYRLGSRVIRTLFHYVLWNISEIVVICLLYTFFTYEGERFGMLDLENQSLLRVFLSALVYATVSIGIPYVIAGQYFAINDKNNTIRLMNFGDAVSDVMLAPQEEKRITLFDNNGVLKFSVYASNLYYIESDDNYIKVWYCDVSGDLRQYMLRCRLKTVEESFSQVSDLVLCHRKYIVNMTKVKILHRERDGYYLNLDLDTVEQIPVSKTYEEAVLARFNSR